MRGINVILYNVEYYKFYIIQVSFINFIYKLII